MTETKTGAGKAKMPLHWKMAIGFAAGLLLGLAAHYGAGADAAWVKWFTSYVTQPAGTLFLRLIFMLVIPLLFSALVMGVAEMGDVRALGRIGWRTLGYTDRRVRHRGGARPGAGEPGCSPARASTPRGRSSCSAKVPNAPARSSAAPAASPRAWTCCSPSCPTTWSRPPPTTAILAVMFFALMLGIGLVLTRSKATETLQRGIEGLFEVSMTLIGLVIRLAPYAVFCFMFNLAALFGWDLLRSLGAYVGVVVLALALHLFVVYSLVLRFAAGYSPQDLLQGRAGSDGDGLLHGLVQRHAAHGAARGRREAAACPTASRASC